MLDEFKKLVRKIHLLIHDCNNYTQLLHVKNYIDRLNILMLSLDKIEDETKEEYELYRSIFIEDKFIYSVKVNRLVAISQDENDSFMELFDKVFGHDYTRDRIFSHLRLKDIKSLVNTCTAAYMAIKNPEIDKELVVKLNKGVLSYRAAIYLTILHFSALHPVSREDYAKNTLILDYILIEQQIPSAFINRIVSGPYGGIKFVIRNLVNIKLLLSASPNTVKLLREHHPVACAKIIDNARVLLAELAVNNLTLDDFLLDNNAGHLFSSDFKRPAWIDSILNNKNLKTNPEYRPNVPVSKFSFFFPGAEYEEIGRESKRLLLIDDNSNHIDLERLKM